MQADCDFCHLDTPSRWYGIADRAARAIANKAGSDNVKQSFFTIGRCPEKGKVLGRKALQEIATIVTPDTILGCGLLSLTGIGSKAVAGLKLGLKTWFWEGKDFLAAYHELQRKVVG